MEASPLLSLNGVSKRFTGGSRPSTVVSALDDLHLEVGRAERVALLGRSGCGKSTLLRVAAGLVRPDSGEASFRGHAIDSPSLERVLVFQDPRLLPWLNVGRNIQLGRALDHSELLALLELVGLPGLAGALPKELSGGMAQRVALARALALRPALLLLDEPLGALDIHTRLALQDMLCKRWDEDGTAVLLVTHDIDEAVYLANRVLVMGEGGSLLGEVIVNLPGAPLRNRDSEAFARYRSEARKLVSGQQVF